MRKALALAVALAPVLTALVGSSATSAETVPFVVPSSASSSDKTADTYGVGGGKTEVGMQTFSLSAHQRPNGNDFGHYNVEVTNALTGALIVRYRVDVDCVNIHAPNRGVVKGEVTKVEPTPNALTVELGERMILGIDDEGGPSATVPTDDFFNPHSDTFPGDCRNIVYIAQVNNVTQGNINIKQG
jgi:hypothetical protein